MAFPVLPTNRIFIVLLTGLYSKDADLLSRETDKRVDWIGAILGYYWFSTHRLRPWPGRNRNSESSMGYLPHVRIELN